jgi:hypothetical protein
MSRSRYWLKYYFSGLFYWYKKSARKKIVMQNRLQKIFNAGIKKLSDASFDNFTYHGEDGIILYLVKKIKNIPPVFVDIGSGDCIKSNCANLAVHFNWDGLFIDENIQQLAIGKNFYKPFCKRGRKIEFITKKVTPDNINEILLKHKPNEEVGLLSVDIDGNDYWIWHAISVIKPYIVVIEAKVEFGLHDVVVPYGEMNHFSFDKMYNGASVTAFKKLGLNKGYNLVGSNRQGYNLFFVRDSEHLPAAECNDLLDDVEIKKSFYPTSFFAEHQFVKF